MATRKTTDTDRTDRTDTTASANGELLPPGRPVEPPANAGDAWEPPAGDTGLPASAEVDDLFDPDALEASDPAPSQPESSRPRPLIPGIDLDSVALEEDFEQTLVDDDSLIVVVRKAGNQGYFRAHTTLWKNIWALEVKNGADRGFYLVAGEALKLLRHPKNEDVKLFPCRLTLCYARDSGLFLWPLRLPQEGRKNQQDEWSTTALRICKMAETTWVKLYTPKGANCYAHKPSDDITDTPPWPEDVPLGELAALAFEGKYITDANDPFILRLLGKA